MKNKIKQILFDADDTLWANNIHYVIATNDFFNLVEENGIKQIQFDKDFDKLEIEVVAKYGYGSKNFVYILEQLFKKYTNNNGFKLNEERFQSIIKRFAEHPHAKPDLFDGVIETLNSLKTKYKLYVLTKGEYEEQKGKILNSGVADIVDDFYIPEEKNDELYKDLLLRNKWNAAETCMVGNSPKSDINPALRVGMYAVYIPYKDTWKLDNEPINKIGKRFLEINCFVDLKKVFI